MALFPLVCWIGHLYVLMLEYVNRTIIIEIKMFVSFISINTVKAIQKTQHSKDEYTPTRHTSPYIVQYIYFTQRKS